MSQSLMGKKWFFLESKNRTFFFRFYQKIDENFSYIFFSGEGVSFRLEEKDFRLLSGLLPRLQNQ